MSSLPAAQLAPAHRVRPPLAIVGKPRQWFAYESGVGRPSARSLLISAIVHVIGIWFLAPIVFQARVHVASLDEQWIATEPTILYAPDLPKIESASANTISPLPATKGTMQKSATSTVHAISIPNEVVPVLLASPMPAAKSPQDLASILPMGDASVSLAPQPVEIKRDRARHRELQPANVDLTAVRTPGPDIPMDDAQVKLGRQAIAIANDRPHAVTTAPDAIPISALPVANPALPVASSAAVKLLSVPTIAGGARGSVIRGGSGAAPALPGGVSAASASTPFGGALAGVGHVTVLNPDPGPSIGAGGNQSGRIAAAPDGVLSGTGLSDSGGGRGKVGEQGTGMAAHRVGVPGVGSRGAGTAPGAHESGGDRPSAIAVENGVVNLGTFGPASVDRPAKGTRPAVVIVSSASASATLSRFAQSFHGDVYTMYLNASGTTAVMQFAERTAAPGGSFSSAVTPPESIRTQLPQGAAGKQVVSCVLNKQGRLTQMRMLLSSTPDADARLLQALEQWRFNPASRDQIPEEVDVLIGFGVDTN